MVSEQGKGMGPDLELDKSEEAALAKENVTVEVPALSESREQKVVLLQPGTDHKGIGFEQFEQNPMPCGDAEDVQVNIIGNGGMSSGCNAKGWKVHVRILLTLSVPVLVLLVIQDPA